MQSAEDLPGMDLARLGEWLPSVVPSVGSSLTARLLAGGRSNLTYELSDGVSTWIVRRPPVGKLLATAHDMAREYRVMAALRDTDVPVPRAFGLCEDDSVLGAPFYVMERVAGYPYRFAQEMVPLGPERTRAISESLVDVLAVLHGVDPTAVGLEDFGRADGFLVRQVKRWKKQFDASRTRELPAGDELYRRLLAHTPPESAIGIVHGDFRLDNVLVDDDDRLTAVLDWELATLGDPLTDVALMLVYGRISQIVGSHPVFNAASAPGYMSETETIERYAGKSERDLAGFGFYLGLASFKLAGILEGINHRYINGQTVGEGFAEVGALVDPLLEGGLEAMKEPC